jgi:hypothetical protein
MIDADEIRARFPIEEEAAKHVTLIQNGREFKALCCFHREKTPSLTFVPRVADPKGVGYFHCFGCAAHGDVIDLVRLAHGVGFPEACEILCGRTERKPTRKPVQSAPIVLDPYADLAAATPPDRRVIAGQWLELWNPKGLLKSPPRPLWKCRADAAYPYRSPDWQLLGYVLRINLEDGGKITPTIRYARCPDGMARWASWRFEKPRPLYRAEYLSREPGPVIVCEGEKAADAAAVLLGALTVTWPNGGKSVHYADWSLLKGRDLYLWGDADQEGEHAMLGKPAMDGLPARPGVAQLASAAGAKIKGIFTWDRSKPKGWDAADALRDGWKRADAVEWMNKQARYWK